MSASKSKQIYSYNATLDTSVLSPSELVDLVLAITQILEVTNQLTLIPGALLVTTDHVHQAIRSAHENLDVLALGLREDLLEQVLGDVAGLTNPLLGGLVENIESTESLGVGVLQLLELVLEEDVLLGHVADNKGNLGLIIGVLEDGAEELVHGGDTGAAGNAGDVLVLVLLPLVLGEGTLDVETLARDHVVHVAGHGSLLVLLDHEVHESLGVLIRDGGVGTNDGLSSLGGELGQDGAARSQSRDLVLLGQLEAEALGVVVDDLNVLEEQGDEALVTACQSGLGLVLDGLLHLVLDLLTRGSLEEVVACAGNGETGGTEYKTLVTAL